jgi:hypothetical protein
MVDLFGQSWSNTVSCPVTYTLAWSNGGTIPYPTNQLFDMRMDGSLWVDINDAGVYSLKINTNYDSVNYASSIFTVTVTCAAYSTLNVNLEAKEWYF